MARPVQVEQRREGLETLGEGRVSTDYSLPVTQIVVPFRGVRQAAPRRSRPSCGRAGARDARRRPRRVRRHRRGRCSSSDDEAARALADELGAEVVDDPGGGQGPAVAAALEQVDGGPALVVNADVPCVVPHDLRTLAGIAELGAVGLVEAEDGTTNALALPRASLFAPLYGARQRRAASVPTRRLRG